MKEYEKKKMEQKAKVTLKEWLAKRYAERKQAFQAFRFTSRGFIPVNLEDIPETEKNKFSYILAGRHCYVKPKRQILVRMGRNKFAKYNLVDVYEKR